MRRIYNETRGPITYSCVYHVVWCSVFRRSVLTDAVQARLKELVQKTCQEQNARLYELDIHPFYVHVRVEIDPILGIHRLIYRIKHQSAQALRKEFPFLTSRVPSLWTNQYFISTEEAYPEERVSEWLEQQPRSDEMRKRKGGLKHGAGK